MEPGLYVLTSFDGSPPPAELTVTDYPDRREVFALKYDSLTIESESAFRRHYEFVYYSVSVATPGDTTVWQGSSYDYRGRIFPRERGLVFDDGDGFFNLPPLKLEVIDGRLIQRIRVSEVTCPLAGSCQVHRNAIIGATYDRR